MAYKMATSSRERTKSGSTQTTPSAGGDDNDKSLFNFDLPVRNLKHGKSAGGVNGTFLIGVGGGTASGKSTVCHKIVSALGQTDVEQTLRRVDVISQECFYRELNDEEQNLADRGLFDFDHPSAFDEKLMVQTIKEIKAGHSVKIPQYDYQKNRGDWTKPKEINPADVILFEGILVFYFKEVRDNFNMKLFVDTDADTRLSRRVSRDIKERGRSLDNILGHYIRFVKPAFEEFCLPTKKYADVIIPRGADNIVAIDLIVQHIQDILKPAPASKSDYSTQMSVTSMQSIDSTASFKSSSDETVYTSAH